MRRAPSLFSDLDATGRFHRDTRLGRMFHPGAVSFREITDEDSLHVAVFPDNRVSVHVDTWSPLLVRHGRPCRYSALRVLAHNLAFVAEAVGRLFRRRCGSHRCELECEAVWVEDAA